MLLKMRSKASNIKVFYKFTSRILKWLEDKINLSNETEKETWRKQFQALRIVSKFDSETENVQFYTWFHMPWRGEASTYISNLIITRLKVVREVEIKGEATKDTTARIEIEKTNGEDINRGIAL